MIFVPTLPHLRYSYGLLATLIHGLPMAEMDPGRHGEASEDADTRARLERVSKVALLGYNQAIGDCDPARLALVLDFIEPDLRPFAYEGAGLGLMILDLCTPWGGGRTGRFLEQVPAFPELVCIGAGQALAVFRRPLAPFLAQIPARGQGPAVDGYGFYSAFFRAAATLERHEVPRAVPPERLAEFDAGVGRSLWFSRAARPEAIAARISGAPAPRQAGLWAGVGFAATYAGGVDEPVLSALRALADTSALARGATAAVLLRHDGGNPTPRDALAARVLCGATPEQLVAARAGA